MTITLPVQNLFYVPMPPPRVWINVGSEVQSVQPPHRSTEKKSAAIARGDDGNEFTKINFFPAGFEVQSPQPPAKPPRRIVGWSDFGEDGTEAPFVPPASTTPVFFESPPTIIRGYRRLTGWSDWGEDGNEGSFVKWVNGGWEIQPPQPPKPKRLSVGWPDFNDDGNYVPAKFVNFGWPVQPPQPPRRRWERSYAGIKSKSEFAIFSVLGSYGFENQAWQPPHIRWERWGAIAPREDGIEAKFVFVAAPFDGWEVQPPMLLHPRPERSGAIASKDDGNEFPRINFYPAGWEIQSVQPPRRYHERRGAIVPREDGTEYPLIGFYPVGYEVAPPLFRPIRPLSGTIARWDDGNQLPPPVVIFTSPWGFEIQSHQPHRIPHPSAAIAQGDVGIEYPLIVWKNGGWEVQSVQPPYPEYRAAAIMPHEDGIEKKFVPPLTFPWGFVSELFQPGAMPNLHMKSGALARWDDGNWLPMILFPSQTLKNVIIRVRILSGDDPRVRTLANTGIRIRTLKNIINRSDD